MPIGSEFLQSSHLILRTITTTEGQMSQITVNRIPRALRGLLQVYEHSCDKNAPVQDPHVRTFLHKQSHQHQLFIRNKIHQNRINLSYTDFPPLQHRLVRPLFLNRFQYDKLESYGIDDLFKPEYNKPITATLDPEVKLPRIVSSRNTSINRYPPYHANMLKSLAAHFSPRKHVPRILTYQNIYKWFHRLLTYTPVVIILRQPQRLLSNGSISQINFPYSNLAYQVNELKKPLEKVLDITRSYHLTQLVDSDILELAIKSKLEFTKNELLQHKDPFAINWARYGSMHDKLCKILSTSKDVKLLRNNEITEEDPQAIFNDDYMNSTLKLLETNHVSDFFPYDLGYNDYHILTIESPILNQDHTEMMNLLLSISDFEVLAVRLDLNNPLISDSLADKSDKPEPAEGYQQMLDSIHKPPVSNVDKLVEFFGEIGLTQADYGFDRDCIYLSRDS